MRSCKLSFTAETEAMPLSYTMLKYLYQFGTGYHQYTSFTFGNLVR